MRFSSLLLPFACLSLAQATGPEVPGVKLTKAIKIDGTIGEDEWNAVPGFHDVKLQADGSPREHPAHFWLAYDDKFIYFAARIEVSDPSTIRATETRQNTSLNGDDSVSLQIDPYGKTGSYNQFAVNPKGATKIDPSGGRATKTEWLGEIQASGRILSSGWEAEVRIPWKVMKCPAPSKRSMGFNVAYKEASSGRTYVFAYTSSMSDQEYALWTDVQMPSVPQDRPIQLLPYFYGGLDNHDRHIVNGGLDLKTALSDQIDLVGTINPDFRNIENQVLSLDFSYFERLAGESRPFFQEGSRYFSTSMDSPIFASQRIRSFDTGWKSYGKLNDRTTFGVLDTIDFGNRNDFAATVKTRLDPTTNATIAATSRSEINAHNEVTFASLTKTAGPWVGYAQAGSSKDSQDGFGRRYNFGGFYFNKGLNVGGEYLEISDAYRTRLGFTSQRDVRQVSANAGWQQNLEKGMIRDYGFSLYTFDAHHTDGTAYNRGSFLSAETTLTNDLEGGVNWSDQVFQGSRDRTLSAGLAWPASDPYRKLGVSVSDGVIQGEHYKSVTLSGLARPMRGLQFSLRHQEVDYFGKAAQTLFSVSYEIDKAWSISGRTVRQDSNWNAYLALRRAGVRGAEYYLILGDPNALRFQRSLILKAVLPLEIKR